MNVRFTRKALADLDQIRSFIGEENPAAATLAPLRRDFLFVRYSAACRFTNADRVFLTDVADGRPKKSPR
jgi:hypothetical protein